MSSNNITPQSVFVFTTTENKPSEVESADHKVSIIAPSSNSSSSSSSLAEKGALDKTKQSAPPIIQNTGSSTANSTAAASTPMPTPFSPQIPPSSRYANPEDKDMERKYEAENAGAAEAGETSDETPIPEENSAPTTSKHSSNVHTTEGELKEREVKEAADHSSYQLAGRDISNLHEDVSGVINKVGGDKAHPEEVLEHLRALRQENSEIRKENKEMREDIKHLQQELKERDERADALRGASPTPTPAKDAAVPLSERVKDLSAPEKTVRDKLEQAITSKKSYFKTMQTGNAPMSKWIALLAVILLAASIAVFAGIRLHGAHTFDAALGVMCFFGPALSGGAIYAGITAVNAKHNEDDFEKIENSIENLEEMKKRITPGADGKISDDGRKCLKYLEELDECINDAYKKPEHKEGAPVVNWLSPLKKDRKPDAEDGYADKILGHTIKDDRTIWKEARRKWKANTDKDIQQERDRLFADLASDRGLQSEMLGEPLTNPLKSEPISHPKHWIDTTDDNLLSNWKADWDAAAKKPPEEKGVALEELVNPHPIRGKLLLKGYSSITIDDAHEQWQKIHVDHIPPTPPPLPQDALDELEEEEEKEKEAVAATPSPHSVQRPVSQQPDDSNLPGGRAPPPAQAQSPSQPAPQPMPDVEADRKLGQARPVVAAARQVKKKPPSASEVRPRKVPWSPEWGKMQKGSGQPPPAAQKVQPAPPPQPQSSVTPAQAQSPVSQASSTITSIRLSAGDRDNITEEELKRWNGEGLINDDNLIDVTKLKQLQKENREKFPTLRPDQERDYFGQPRLKNPPSKQSPPGPMDELD